MLNCRTIIIFLIAIILILGIYAYFKPKHNIDIDCLIDRAESTDITILSEGKVHEGYTLKDLKEKYMWKYPQSRFLVKRVLQVEFNKCANGKI